jgi:hypothetical protein
METIVSSRGEEVTSFSTRGVCCLFISGKPFLHVLPMDSCQLLGRWDGILSVALSTEQDNHCIAVFRQEFPPMQFPQSC